MDWVKVCNYQEEAGVVKVVKENMDYSWNYLCESKWNIWWNCINQSMEIKAWPVARDSELVPTRKIRQIPANVCKNKVTQFSFFLRCSNLKLPSSRTTLGSQLFMGRPAIPQLWLLKSWRDRVCSGPLYIQPCSFPSGALHFLSGQLFSMAVTSSLLPTHLIPDHFIPLGIFAVIIVMMSIIYIIVLSKIIIFPHVPSIYNHLLYTSLNEQAH